MPYINAKISKPITKEQETQIKTMFGEAITTIPGKSENWLIILACVACVGVMFLIALLQGKINKASDELGGL